MSSSFLKAIQDPTLSQSSGGMRIQAENDETGLHKIEDETGLHKIESVEFLYGEKVSSPSTWTNLKNRVSLIANAIGTNLAKIIKSVINAILAPVYCLKRFFFECKSSDISSAKH